MGPCPKCRRHVKLSEHKCPFCGAKWLLSAAAAAGMLLGGDVWSAPKPDSPVTAQDKVPEYGVPRRDVAEVEWVWTKVHFDWKAKYGFSPSATNWSGFRSAVFTVSDGKLTGSLTYRLSRVGDDSVTLATDIGERTVPLKPSPPKDARVTDLGNGVTRYEWAGMNVRVSKKDGRVVRVESDNEKSELVKTEELEVQGKKLSCELWEITRGETKIREWRSAEVPGMIVKWESGSKTVTLSSFEVKK